MTSFTVSETMNPHDSILWMLSALRRICVTAKPRVSLEEASAHKATISCSALALLQGHVTSPQSESTLPECMRSYLIMAVGYMPGGSGIYAILLKKNHLRQLANTLFFIMSTFIEDASTLLQSNVSKTQSPRDNFDWLGEKNRNIGFE